MTNARPILMTFFILLSMPHPLARADDGERIVREAIKKATAEKKYVLLVFKAVWCPFSKAFDRRLKVNVNAGDKRLQRLLQKKYVVAHIPLVPPDSGRKHVGKWTINMDLVRRYKVNETPNVVVLKSNGKFVENVPLRWLGWLEGGKRLHERLKGYTTGSNDGSNASYRRIASALQRANKAQKPLVVLFNVEWDLESTVLAHLFKGYEACRFKARERKGGRFVRYVSNKKKYRRVFDKGKKLKFCRHKRLYSLLKNRFSVLRIETVPTRSRDRHRGEYLHNLSLMRRFGITSLPYVAIFTKDGKIGADWRTDMDTRVGSGVYYGKDNKGYLVVKVVSGGPAEKAGIRPQDRIVKVAGKRVKGMNMKAVGSLFVGKEGEKLEFWVLRKGWRSPKRRVVVRTLIDFKKPKNTTHSSYSVVRLKKRNGEDLPIVDGDLAERRLRFSLQD